jgi:hypothetical protein
LALVVFCSIPFSIFSFFGVLIMKLSKLLSSIFFSASVIGSHSFAATAVAPQSRINLWTGSSAIADSNFTIGTRVPFGTVKTLKANAAVTNSLSALDLTSGKFLGSKSWNSSSHQQVSENGVVAGQCVAFAKSMTSTKSTPYWYKGFATGSYVNPNTQTLIPAPSLVLQGGMPMQSGTMLAYFNGLSQYPQNGDGHVLIFLNWTYDSFTGKVSGMDVVNENLVWTVDVNGATTTGASALVQKHWLPWSCTTGSLCSTDSRYNNPRYYAQNYHVVDVR